MSTATVSLAPNKSRWNLMLTDWVTLTWRNLVAYMRIPEQAFFSTIQPVMFILLFRYVFAGAINVGSLNYTDYLMPGIFAQTVAFGSIGTSTGLAEDLAKGLIERFRSLPMAQSSVLVGRTIADMVRNVFVIILMAAVGFAVGFRIHAGIPAFIAGLGLLLLLSYSLAWAFVAIGLNAPNAETAQLMSFPILMPLTFASSAFVPVRSMPGWLQVWARNQPVSVVISASRQLMLGHDALVRGLGAANVPSLSGEVTKAVLWCIGIFAVLGPLTAWRFAHKNIT